MTTERITVEAVEAAVVEYDAKDRAVVAGQAVIDFTQLGVMVSLLAPREWEIVAAYLYGLLERAPVAGGRAYVPHRTILGALAGELRGYARLAGEPVGLEADLRGASSQEEERRIRARMADQAAAFDRHIDDVIASQHAQHDAAVMDAATHHALATEDEFVGTNEPEEDLPDVWKPAAPEMPDDDASAWA